jgi:nucleotide sugar dehydrogenase
MPEYTDSISGLLQNLNYDVCYNPSFIAQGSIISNLQHPNFVLIGGNNEDCMRRLADVHKSFIQNNADVHMMKPLEAEITKISLNCFITTKISFANMVGDLLVSKGLDPGTVLNAIGSDIRVGNKYLSYGYGFGGPCFPRDNRALSFYAKSQGHNFQLCKTTDRLNNQHLLYQYEKLKNKGEPVEFTFITYKDDSDILDESQKLKLAEMLARSGISVLIKEREHIIKKLKDHYSNMFEYVVKT